MNEKAQEAPPKRVLGVVKGPADFLKLHAQADFYLAWRVRPEIKEIFHG